MKLVFFVVAVDETLFFFEKIFMQIINIVPPSYCEN